MNELIRLRDSRDDRVALITATSDHFKIPAEFVEKDFWVVETLRSLYKTSHQDSVLEATQIVFKGGTSLSKALKLTRRFSEDIDILIVPPSEFGAGRIDGILKLLVVEVTKHLGITTESVEVISTKGKKRNARFHYAADYPATMASQGVLLEMGIRGGTSPGLLPIPVMSFIAEYLGATNQFGNFIEEKSVETLVLDPVRTLFEKLCALHTAAMKVGNGKNRNMAKAGRHYYDVHALLSSNVVLEGLKVAPRTAILEEIKTISLHEGWEFFDSPSGGFAESPAFQMEGLVGEMAQRSYEESSALFYGEPPLFEECLMIAHANSHLL